MTTAFHTPLATMRIRDDSRSHLYGAGVRRNPDGSARDHHGWDLAATIGTPVFAIAPGTVVATGFNPVRRGRNGKQTGDYGLWLTLEFLHEGSLLYAFYAHLKSIVVKYGSVEPGPAIAYTGVSGRTGSSSPHLHFEIRKKKHAIGFGQRVDPQLIFPSVSLP